IQKIVETIGVEKFEVIVTNGAMNMKLAKSLVNQSKKSHQTGELLQALQQEYLISSSEFFNNVECLAQILYSAKEAVKAVEYKLTSLADVYIQL
ncbi:12833_t:CDS:2, partial [Cetraspora pellucida]